MTQFKQYLISFLLIAVVSGLGVGMFGSVSTVIAQDGPQHFMVVAGASGPGNIDALIFAPEEIQVHRGDTITWAIVGFHNVRLSGEAEHMEHHEEEHLEFVLVSEEDGQPVFEINPRVAFPDIESGTAYTGGEGGSGLPLLPGAEPIFSLTIDVEPGIYHYHCDVHPGMDGTIVVVEEDVAIPSPTEVALQGAGEIGEAINTGFEVRAAAQESAMNGDPTQVAAGAEQDLVAVQGFFPSVAVIEAGQSVTWSIPEDYIEPHTITWPPIGEEDQFELVETEDGQPRLLFQTSFVLPSTPSGGDWVTDGQNHSGLLEPGNSYTLTFPEPGVYRYVCVLHPGMEGTVVVMPAE